MYCFFFSSRRRHTRCSRDWSSDVCSSDLYHLDRAKEGIRRQDFAILVEGYMDAIAVARVGISNVVASCGTSLAEQQIKLLSRFTKRVVVNYDPEIGRAHV